MAVACKGQCPGTDQEKYMDKCYKEKPVVLLV